MDIYSEPLVDRHGAIMFRCDHCAAPISRSDVLELGLRLPDPTESADEYLDAELIDSFRHPSCIVASKAS